MNRLMVCCLAVVLGGCVSFSRDQVAPEDQFGHRVDGVSDDGRTTITINPPDESVTYRFFPASYESVAVRPATMTPDKAATGVPVEILVKGAFPDACTELHDVSQQRQQEGRFLDITLQMRRPQGSVCAAVLRPYRFYLMLEGLYPPGAYTITLNGGATPFEIPEPESGNRR